MVWLTLEAKLSTPRMSRYLNSNCGSQARAAEAYVHNMKIAESLVTVFHVLEVALRNGIQKEMAREYGHVDWYESWNGAGDIHLQKLYDRVAVAKNSAASTMSHCCGNRYPSCIVIFPRSSSGSTPACMTGSGVMTGFPTCWLSG